MVTRRDNLWKYYEDLSNGKTGAKKMRKRATRTTRQATKRKRKKKKKFLPGPPIQYHHDEYEPDGGEAVSETAGHLFKGEHGIITALRRQTRNVSSWFIECLERWVEESKDMHADGIRVWRNLDREIEELPEGQSHHCPYCGKGFLVKKNKGNHMLVCKKRSVHL
jgi:hypothetical protein